MQALRAHPSRPKSRVRQLLSASVVSPFYQLRGTMSARKRLARHPLRGGEERLLWV
jgi:hypothetical protein